MRIIATTARGQTHKNEHENGRKTSVSLMVPSKSSFLSLCTVEFVFLFFTLSTFIIITAVAAV